MDEGDRYTHHSVEEGDWYTHHSVDVGHVEADAGEEVADRVHHEYRVPTSGAPSSSTYTDNNRNV